MLAKARPTCQPRQGKKPSMQLQRLSDKASPQVPADRAPTLRYTAALPACKECPVEEGNEPLRGLSEPDPVPLELPEEETLVEIQEQSLIHLPFELREYLLKVSDVVYGRLEPVTASDPHSHTYLPEVASVAWDLGLPRELVPLCQDGRDYYA